MKRSPSHWRAALLRRALTGALLLSVSLAHGQVAIPPNTKDEKSPLPKKAVEEDPPLPSKKPAAAKEARVQVTAPSAEVQFGDEVVATVKRGEVLPFTKKTDDYYLVIVNSKKGWIKRESVREIEAGSGPDAPAIEAPAGPAPAVIDKDAARKVKQATAYLRVRMADGSTVEGSGVFAVEPGLVLTNAHVLGMLRPGSLMPEEVRVVAHSGEADEFTLPAQVLGVDRENDLGMLRVKGRASRLPAPLRVETSRALDLVQKVYIFGFPFGTSLGKDITASESSVSSIRKNAAGSAIQIQVNGGMHPGNSGGPVVDSRGVVIGIAVSVIRGTQINFAVPGERVQDLLGGRVAQSQIGEAFLDQGQAKLPVILSCLDPLQRIRKVEVEIWPGKTAPARPPSATEPSPLPGDGVRRSFAADYQAGSARIDVSIPSLADGQALWIQPVLTDIGGARRWGEAVAYKPSDLPPLERKAVVLQESFDRQADRTIKLTGAYKVQVLKGLKQTLFRDSMEVEALETAQKEPRGGRVDLFLGAYKYTTTDMDGKPRPVVLPRAQALLRDRNLTFILDSQGALLQRTIPVLNPPVAREVREDFADLVQQIANSYEMTCLAVPNRRIAAQETWQARVPIFLSSQEKKEFVDMFLTCTYVGSRKDGEEPYAVVSVSGYVKGRKPGQKSTGGTVTGVVRFAIGDGFLSQANIKVESEADDDDISVAHSLDLSLTRIRGNKSGIVARPVGRVPGPPPATGTDYELAVPHLQRSDFDQAIPLLEKAIAANPNLVQAQGDLGFAYNQKGLYDKAIPCLKKVIELVPNQATAHINLGAAYNGKGLYDDAIPCFKKAIELDPTNAVAQSNLGVAYNSKRLFDQAIPCFDKAIELNPQYVGAHTNLGYAYNAKRLPDKAIACLKKAVALDPKHVDAHNGLGVAYNARGLYEDAIPCFKRALELQPKHAAALNNLGFAYNAMGLYDQGIPFLKKAVEIDAKFAAANDNLAAALGEVGQLEQARDVLKKALALTPETAPQLESTKRSLQRMETLLRLEGELPDIMKAEWKPKNFEEGMQVGKVCRLKQYYVAALRFYEQLLTSDPDAAKKLAPVNFFIVARAALRASAGSGNDPPPEADRPKYRAKALAALQKFVNAHQQALEKDFSGNRYSCQNEVRALLLHKDLALVRPPALKNFPVSERKEWEDFWNEVETLLEKADALPSDPSAGQNP